ncbi:hypothetical protein NKR23_g10022 [Pleurostoma richardsiae]|uniref:Clr5 domain-containing protein n=1 Tax=Pleurostoma richardsiae TaxID=41990 RepID=A0AA38REB0_9PEZI|nr:hypothetical protein NKR23_g10022 [Pleurostoma richardsiae]
MDKNTSFYDGDDLPATEWNDDEVAHLPTFPLDISLPDSRGRAMAAASELQQTLAPAIEGATVTHPNLSQVTNSSTVFPPSGLDACLQPWPDTGMNALLQPWLGDDVSNVDTVPGGFDQGYTAIPPLAYTIPTQQPLLGGPMSAYRNRPGPSLGMASQDISLFDMPPPWPLGPQPTQLLASTPLHEEASLEATSRHPQKGQQEMSLFSAPPLWQPGGPFAQNILSTHTQGNEPPLATTTVLHAGQEIQLTIRTARGPGLGQKSRQISPAVWESHKETIRRLYLGEWKPLREVIKIMSEEYGFHATEKMYKVKIRVWGWGKNNTEKEIARLLRLEQLRFAEGKATQVTRHGKPVKMREYLRRKGRTEYDLLCPEPGALPINLPEGIRCQTPPPTHMRLPDMLRDQGILVGAMRQAMSFYVQGTDPARRAVDAIGYSAVIEFAQAVYDFSKQGLHRLACAAAGQLCRSLDEYIDDLRLFVTLQFLFDTLNFCEIWPGIAMEVCKYLAALAENRRSKHPLCQVFTLLYRVMREGGAASLSSLLEECSGAVADALESMLGADDPVVLYASVMCFPDEWLAARGQEWRRRFLHVQDVTASRFGAESRESARSRLWYIDFLGSVDDERYFESLEGLMSDLEAAPATRTSWQYIASCTYRMYEYHYDRCAGAPAEYNMRHGLARHYLRQSIDIRIELYGEDNTEALAFLPELECMYRAAGDVEGANEARAMRERGEALYLQRALAEEE